MTRGVKDNVNRAVDKYLNDFSLDHFGIMNESMGKSESMNGDIRLDEGRPAEARTIE